MTDQTVAKVTPFHDLLLVCRKCGKKLDGGFGRKSRQRLATEVKDILRASGRRHDLRVIETGCLSLCPKKAVTVVLGSRPGEMLAVPKGADVAALVDRLAGPASPAGQ